MEGQKNLTNYDLKPTEENLIKSIENNMVGRNRHIARFIKFLDATEGNTIVALDDSWGNGKTFFVKQTQLVLQSYITQSENLSSIRECEYFKANPKKRYIPVYYDAWSNDNDEDPVLSIIFRLIQDMPEFEDCDVVDRDKKKILSSALETLVTAFGGPRIQTFLESVVGDDVLAEIKKIKQTEQVLNDLFDLLLKKFSNDGRIVFFVDELDRCRPDFAVRLLERIKHYFVNENVIFVLSINSLELQHTIKRHYGNDFNADKYLHRFFDFTTPLPKADMTKIYQTVELNISNAIDDIARCVMIKYNFSIRDITRYVQYLRVAIPKNFGDCSQKHTYEFYCNVLIPFLIGLKVHDSKKYDEFINGKNFGDLIEVMQFGNLERYFAKFRTDNEPFDSSLSLEEKFRPVYECLFVAGGRNQYSTGTGLNFSDDDKDFILETISLMRSDKF